MGISECLGYDNTSLESSEATRTRSNTSIKDLIAKTKIWAVYIFKNEI